MSYELELLEKGENYRAVTDAKKCTVNNDWFRICMVSLDRFTEALQFTRSFNG